MDDREGSVRLLNTFKTSPQTPNGSTAAPPVVMLVGLSLSLARNDPSLSEKTRILHNYELYQHVPNM